MTALQSACRDKQRSPALKELRIPEPTGHFRREGYVQMVPPLLLPRRTARNIVEVWLKLPENGVISTRAQEGRILLRLPPGARAARVEKIGRGRDLGDLQWSVADVRATRFEAQGEVFSVLRPEGGQVHSPLVGWEWRRGSPEQQAEATRLVAELAASVASPEQAEGERRAARRANACASCHEYARPENTRSGEHGLANRATDASGCFQIQNILVSQLPLETYFPLEMNRDSPFVRFGCKNGDAPVNEPPKHPTCSDGSVPWGRFDVRAALAASSDHAEDLCAARRYLFARMDDTGRRAFQEGFLECGLAAAAVTASPAPP